ncbi:pyroglutamyl-peptidase I [Biomaibacter acetigenes]|uniref:Pyrrolidone-carboxylate peptidase n=1 Tax=Biomaibacter acetigenes TaxID=2316383 RepID=A0A3G2R2E5_9FIRM|nr:pyroglutamyl-peptidase I [Biomaibacter acetigenes]AYO29542.1 pyroglutamyl-peptidase I [Biomaibacter acetigenes]
MNKIILLTGFEPFGGDSINPSLEIAKNLQGKDFDGFIVKALEVPVRDTKCLNVMENAIKEYQPSVIISVGLAWGRSAISLERIGINTRDYPIPDNDGQQPINQPIDPEGPAAYFSTLPIRAIVKELRDSGIPAYISNTAGTYLCNQVMYGTLNYITKNQLPIKSGFIHIPYLSSQIAQKGEIIPSLPFETLVNSIEIAIKTSIRQQEDILLIAGAVN